jgi:hypothetical protein
VQKNSNLLYTILQETVADREDVAKSGYKKVYAQIAAENQQARNLLHKECEYRERRN